MRKSERLVFDFETNAWVMPDSFNTRAQGLEISLETPDTAPSEGRWNKPPVHRATPPAAILMAWACVAGILAAFPLHSVFPIIPAVMFGMMAVGLREAPDLAITEADRMLMEDPDDRDVCLVRITIVREGVKIGTDKGVVWFADGMILYNGHRTSFALGGEDVLPREQWGIFQNGEGISSLMNSMLPLRLGGTKAYVHFVPLRIGDAHEMRFLKRFYDFRRRPPQSRGSRQWPPLHR